MPKLIATSTILEHELSELRLLVERQTGIVLDTPNSSLSAHVSEFIETQGIGSAAALLERLRGGDIESTSIAGLLDGLISTKTGFFRHQSALNALAKQVVPQLCARKAIDGPSPLRIWSAGCGSGEETYSIAVSVCDALSQCNAASSAAASGKSSSRNGGIVDIGLNNSAATFSIHIVGSDLLPRNIETADRGIYPQSALTGLAPAIIKNYFSKINSPAVAVESEGETLSEEEDESVPRRKAKNGTLPAAGGAHLLVKPRLRSLVTFNCMNLARPGYIGRFDCIFCMDVLTQMSRAQKIALIDRLHLYLEPGGYLFLGQTEKLLAQNLNFRSEAFDGYTFHRKPLAASAAYGR